MTGDDLIIEATDRMQDAAIKVKNLTEIRLGLQRELVDAQKVVDGIKAKIQCSKVEIDKAKAAVQCAASDMKERAGWHHS